MSNEVSLGTILGGVIAGFLSYAKWGSVLLAFIHGFFCGWFYVVYYFFKYGFHNLKF